MELLIERYANETISNSGLTALSVSPRMYRNYKDKVESNTESYFNLGSAIHCKVLEPEEFDDRYLITNVVAPGGMYAKFIDVLFRTRRKEGEVNALEEASWKTNAHAEAGFKWPLDKVWSKFKSEPDLYGYYDTLVQNADSNKVILTLSDKSAIDACVEGIQSHEKASELMYGHVLSDCRNELDIRWTHPEFPEFMMRSILDRLIIDEGTKTAKLVDLKTTSKSVHSFKYSYKQYSYHRQMGLYKQALLWYLENEYPHISRHEWAIEVYIVATQTNGYGDTAVYSPSITDLKLGQDEASKLLARMKWHFDNDKWQHPMEYYTNDGVIELNINEQ